MQILFDARAEGVGATFRPSFSIVVAVHNNLDAVRVGLPPLLRHTAGCAEMLLLLDDCTSNAAKPERDAYVTLLSLLEHGDAFRRSDLRRVRILQSRTALWEACSESVLMSISNPHDFYISVQPDTVIFEPAWNLYLAVPVLAFPDVFAVSALSAAATGYGVPGIWRQFTDRYYPKNRTVTLRRRQVHALDRDHPLFPEADLNVSRAELGSASIADLRKERALFRVRETVNRGPLLMHAGRARMLQFFDFELYHFEHSDHDLTCRAAQLGWAVGYYALNATTGPAYVFDQIAGKYRLTHRTRHDTKFPELTPGYQNLSFFIERRRQIIAGKYAGSLPQPRLGCLVANRDAIVAAQVRSEDRIVANAEVLFQRLQEAGCASIRSAHEAATELHHGVCHKTTRDALGERKLLVPWPGWAGWKASKAPPERETPWNGNRWFSTPSDGVKECSSLS